MSLFKTLPTFHHLAAKTISILGYAISIYRLPGSWHDSIHACSAYNPACFFLNYGDLPLTSDRISYFHAIYSMLSFPFFTCQRLIIGLPCITVAFPFYTLPWNSTFLPMHSRCTTVALSGCLHHRAAIQRMPLFFLIYIFKQRKPAMYNC